MRRSHLVGFTIVVIWDTIIHEKRSSEKTQENLEKLLKLDQCIRSHGDDKFQNSKSDYRISEGLERFERFKHLNDLIVGINLEWPRSTFFKQTVAPRSSLYRSHI